MPESPKPVNMFKPGYNVKAVPQDRVQELKQDGWENAYKMTGPEGQKKWVPASRVSELRSDNYEVPADTPGVTKMVSPENKITYALPEEVDQFKGSGHSIVPSDEDQKNEGLIHKAVGWALGKAGPDAYKYKGEKGLINDTIDSQNQAVEDTKAKMMKQAEVPQPAFQPSQPLQREAMAHAAALYHDDPLKMSFIQNVVNSPKFQSLPRPEQQRVLKGNLTKLPQSDLDSMLAPVPQLYAPENLQPEMMMHGALRDTAGIAKSTATPKNAGLAAAATFIPPARLPIAAYYAMKGAGDAFEPSREGETGPDTLQRRLLGTATMTGGAAGAIEGGPAFVRGPLKVAASVAPKTTQALIDTANLAKTPRNLGRIGGAAAGEMLGSRVGLPGMITGAVGGGAAGAEILPGLFNKAAKVPVLGKVTSLLSHPAEGTGLLDKPWIDYPPLIAARAGRATTDMNKGPVSMTDDIKQILTGQSPRPPGYVENPTTASQVAMNKSLMYHWDRRNGRSQPLDPESADQPAGNSFGKFSPNTPLIPKKPVSPIYIMRPKDDDNED